MPVTVIMIRITVARHFILSWKKDSTQLPFHNLRMSPGKK